MIRALQLVPASHRQAFQNWIETAGLPTVVPALAWLATFLLHQKPGGRLYGLSAPELLVLVQELQTP